MKNNFFLFFTLSFFLFGCVTQKELLEKVISQQSTHQVNTATHGKLMSIKEITQQITFKNEKTDDFEELSEIYYEIYNTESPDEINLDSLDRELWLKDRKEAINSLKELEKDFEKKRSQNRNGSTITTIITAATGLVGGIYGLISENQESKVAEGTSMIAGTISGVTGTLKLDSNAQNGEDCKNLAKSLGVEFIGEYGESDYPKSKEDQQKYREFRKEIFDRLQACIKNKE